MKKPSACPTCKQVPDAVPGSQKILQISLPRSLTTDSLTNLIKQHLSIHSQTDGRRCGICVMGNPTSPEWPYLEKLNISNYPPYLFIQLLRMDFIGGKVVKNIKPITICEEVPVGNARYRAIGITTHIGSADSGHNRAYIKKGSSWFLCEDDKIPYVFLSPSNTCRMRSD